MSDERLGVELKKLQADLGRASAMADAAWSVAKVAVTELANALADAERAVDELESAAHRAAGALRAIDKTQGQIDI